MNGQTDNANQPPQPAPQPEPAVLPANNPAPAGQPDQSGQPQGGAPGAPGGAPAALPAAAPEAEVDELSDDLNKFEADLKKSEADVLAQRQPDPGLLSKMARGIDDIGYYISKLLVRYPTNAKAQALAIRETALSERFEKVERAYERMAQKPSAPPAPQKPAAPPAAATEDKIMKLIADQFAEMNKTIAGSTKAGRVSGKTVIDLSKLEGELGQIRGGLGGLALTARSADIAALTTGVDKMSKDVVTAIQAHAQVSQTKNPARWKIHSSALALALIIAGVIIFGMCLWSSARAGSATASQFQKAIGNDTNSSTPTGSFKAQISPPQQPTQVISLDDLDKLQPQQSIGENHGGLSINQTINISGTNTITGPLINNYFGPTNCQSAPPACNTPPVPSALPPPPPPFPAVQDQSAATNSYSYDQRAYGPERMLILGYWAYQAQPIVYQPAPLLQTVHYYNQYNPANVPSVYQYGNYDNSGYYNGCYSGIGGGIGLYFGDDSGGRYRFSRDNRDNDRGPQNRNDYRYNGPQGSFQGGNNHGPQNGNDYRYSPPDPSFQGSGNNRDNGNIGNGNRGGGNIGGNNRPGGGRN